MKDILFRFNNDDIRIIDKAGDPWFVVTDVCKILGLTNPSLAIKNIKKNALSTVYIIDSMGRKQRVNIVNDSGLYKLIFKSRRKEAEKFTEWVTDTVLPAIRKTGKYEIAESLSLKEKSTKARNLLTGEWSKCGIKKPDEYAELTREEYRQLQFEKGKRKKDMDEGEIRTLFALEALESLNLFYNPVEGFIEVKTSLTKSAQTIAKTKKDQLSQGE